MILIIMSIENEEDRSFVAALYRKYSKKMFLTANGILHNAADAEDCVSETVMVIIDNLERFASLEGDDLIKLIVICCRNVAIDLYRKKKKRPDIQIDDGNGDPGGIADPEADVGELCVSRENCRYLHDLINRLDTIYRDTVILRYYYEMSNKEIADMMKISESLVSVRLTRAKKMLLGMGGERLYEIYKA